MHQSTPSDVHTFVVTNVDQNSGVLDFVSRKICVVCVKAEDFRISTTKAFLHPDCEILGD